MLGLPKEGEKRRKIPLVGVHLISIRCGSISSYFRRCTDNGYYVLNSSVLQEIHDEKGNEVLISGVFDGHGGTAGESTQFCKALGVISNGILPND